MLITPRLLKRLVLYTVLVLLPGYAPAGSGELIFSREIAGEFQQVMDGVKQALEEARFYVIFEANIGRNLARNADSWGEEYNRNGFEEVRSLVICNPWYANRVLNLDPEKIALCPFTIGLLHKDGITTVLFERPGAVSGESAASDVLWEIENTIVSAIESVTGH